MSGETLDYKKHMSLQLGQYFQVHEEDNPRNSQIARTKGEISLGPSGNLQGRFKFMDLNSTPATLRARPHGRTDKSKRPESHPTKECARARVRCLKTEPN
jgi:hypothetical protein